MISAKTRTVSRAARMRWPITVARGHGRPSPSSASSPGAGEAEPHEGVVQPLPLPVHRGLGMFRDELPQQTEIDRLGLPDEVPDPGGVEDPYGLSVGDL